MSQKVKNFEIFISYSRKDNGTLSNNHYSKVTEFVQSLVDEHQKLSTEQLRIFFDISEIKDMDDWKEKILQGLRSSIILVVCISPNYYESEPCKWEFEEYLSRQVHIHAGNDSIAHIYFADISKIHEETKKTTWFKLIQNIEFTDLRNWFSSDSSPIREKLLKDKVSILGDAIWERIQRNRNSIETPTNIRDLNPHFTGRVDYLQHLHNVLNLSKVGAISLIHGLGGQGKTELAIAYGRKWSHIFGMGIWLLNAEGKKHILPLIGELINCDFFCHLKNNDHSKEESAYSIIACLKKLSLEKNDSNKCLIIFDNVTNSELLSDSQTTLVPRESWLNIIVTTKESPDRFYLNINRNISPIAVDGLSEKDALNLFKNHQPDTYWYENLTKVEKDALVTIIKILNGFTLALEGIAIYLGLHRDIQPSDYLHRINIEGINSVNSLLCDSEVKKNILHREKQLSLILKETLEGLSILERTAVEIASLLPYNSIPWIWLVELLNIVVPTKPLATKRGYPDPTISLKRRLTGLRLLTPSDSLENYKMHVLVSCCISEAIPLKSKENLTKIIANYICNVDTPFKNEVPINSYINCWNLYSENFELNTILIHNALNFPCTDEIFLNWIDLSYTLGNSSLESWWLKHWEESNVSKNEKYISRKAAFYFRMGNLELACSTLKQYLQSFNEDSLDIQNQLLMYIVLIGEHPEAFNLINKIEFLQSRALEKDCYLKAKFLHHKYFILHETDLNADAVKTNLFIQNVYKDLNLTYDYLISCVNLADSLWGVGKFEEAIDLLEYSLKESKIYGLSHVQNISAICLANVISSTSTFNSAYVLELYNYGVNQSALINHQWDYLYGQLYRLIYELEQKIPLTINHTEIISNANKFGYRYLSEITNAYLCVASFTSEIDRVILDEAIKLGIKSIYPACKIYAISSLIKRKLEEKKSLEFNLINDWYLTLMSLQGIKGRIGIIYSVSCYLIENDFLPEEFCKGVDLWVNKYIDVSLKNFYRSRYTF